MSRDLFPGFAERRIKTPETGIFARVGGAGPPLLLLHGYPQTHACWHKITPALARAFTVVVADLRGYGQSAAPPGGAGHRTYSKRAMAEDCAALMHGLGFGRFVVAGHDRGGRVGYRLALDRPDVVTRLAVLDILPTIEVWERMNAASALASYHWTFLAQPYPMPETLIAASPGYYADHTLASWTRDKTLGAFAPEALDQYRAQFSSPERIHAMCEDYRAGATYDRVADAGDRAAGRKIACPTLALWGSNYVGRGAADPLAIWGDVAANVTGREIESGHFLAEENPGETLKSMMAFFTGSA